MWAEYQCNNVEIVMLELGIKGRRELIVGTEHTAKHIGSGTVLVLATPMMIALMETTSRMSVKPYLEEGQETVGTHVDVSHDSAVPVGNKVWCESEVIDIKFWNIFNELVEISLLSSILFFSVLIFVQFK